MRKKKRNWQP